jgi:hypothetical protein
MKRFIPILPWLGALLFIAFGLLFFESDLLWKVQQYNLFLDTPLFFRDQMLVSGGFLTYVSCFFTQFFFHPWMGVTILCGWWLLLMWIVRRTFCIADDWTVLALIPMAILLVADMSMGYWHYFMKLRGYFYVATIGTTSAIALLWAFRVLPQRLWLRIIWLVVTTAIGYPLLGCYALAAVLLMGIWTWRLSGNPTENAVLTIAALLCIISVPLYYYRYVYYQTCLSDVWTTALPTFIIMESYPLNYIPYYLLGAFFLLMVIFYQKALSFTVKKPLPRWSPQIVLVVVLTVSVWHFWYKDDNFHHELAMQHCIEITDWEGVLREGQQVEEPTHAIVMMHNLALMKLGRQLDEMYDFPKASKKSNTPLTINMVYHVFARMIYYHYGLLNDCHRISMEDGVEYGWRVETLEYMARCSLLSGEMQAAHKALSLLRHTKYHGKWADAMQQLVDHPEQIVKARETGPITSMMHYDNALSIEGGDVEKNVMSLLADQDADDPYFQEQAVLGALWMRDQQKFWKRFTHYAELLPNAPMPRIFQEGAYLFGKMENRADLDQLPFDKSVKETYNAFMNDAAKYNNQEMAVVRDGLYPYYGNTYYYEYYFVNNAP